MIKGQVINDKHADTIIKAIEKKWIVGDGVGPGHPSRGFFSDNGGEFLNEQLIDFAAAMDITIKMTAASGPWMNGSCERAHATVDKIVEKILDDEPKTDLQKAVNRACFVKNMEINKTGFSPLQLFCGRTPSFPGYSDCTPSSIELEGSNEYLQVLRRLDEGLMKQEYMLVKWIVIKEKNQELIHLRMHLISMETLFGLNLILQRNGWQGMCWLRMEKFCSFAMEIFLEGYLLNMWFQLRNI